MKHDQFVKELADHKLLEAVAAAEARSSAKIGIVISRRPVKDPIASARRHHRMLKFDAGRQRNNVLIFISPRSRNFSIYAGEGAHSVVPQAFWDDLSNDLASGFREGRYTETLTDVVCRVGEVLARHFPATT